MEKNAKLIWEYFLVNGISPIGAAAMLGNMQAESALNPINVEDRMHTRLGWSDELYTQKVDNKSYTNFVSDGYGYGLYQITYGPRKRNFLNFVQSRKGSIGDLGLQCLFCIKEFKEEYAGLWNYLCGAPDLYIATQRICEEFERPAVKNVDTRYTMAQIWYNKFNNLSVDTPVSQPKNEYWPPRTIDIGMSGPDVLVWQALMNAMGFKCSTTGKFDKTTQVASKAFQKANQLTEDGIPGPKSWAAALKI